MAVRAQDMASTEIEEYGEHSVTDSATHLVAQEPANTTWPATKVFGIMELLEQILTHLVLRYEDSHSDFDSSLSRHIRVRQLFALQMVNRSFRDTIAGSSI